jgi:hypothetical protein
MRKYFVLLLLYSCTSNLLAQKFTTTSKDQHLISLSDGSLRLNYVQSDGKVYYSTDVFKDDNDYLSEINMGSGNSRLLPWTPTQGACALAATTQFIYYISYLSEKKSYALYRLNKGTDKVEPIVSEDNKPVLYSRDWHNQSRMYTNKDVLVFLSVSNRENNTRSLNVVLDSLPIAYSISNNATDFRATQGVSVSYYPMSDEIAITDSMVYLYTKKTNLSNGINVFRKYDARKPNRPFPFSSFVNLDSVGYEPLNDKLVAANGKVYSIMQKKGEKKTENNARLVEFEGKEGNIIATLTFSKENEMWVDKFVKVFGNLLYICDAKNLYEYNTATRKLKTVIQLKGNVYFGLIQNEEYLLQGNNGTIFASIREGMYDEKRKIRDYLKHKVVAIHATGTVDTICTIDDIKYGRTFYSVDRHPSFVMGNSLYRVNYDAATKNEWLIKYSKENNWAPVRIDYPDIKKYKLFPDLFTKPAVFQLKDALLIRTRYGAAKRGTDVEVMYLYTEK